jgi:hypothetical protein
MNSLQRLDQTVLDSLLYSHGFEYIYDQSSNYTCFTIKALIKLFIKERYRDLIPFFHNYNKGFLQSRCINSKHVMFAYIVYSFFILEKPHVYMCIGKFLRKFKQAAEYFTKQWRILRKEIKDLFPNYDDSFTVTKIDYDKPLDQSFHIILFTNSLDYFKYQSTINRDRSTCFFFMNQYYPIVPEANNNGVEFINNFEHAVIFAKHPLPTVDDALFTYATEHFEAVDIDTQDEYIIYWPRWREIFSQTYMNTQMYITLGINEIRAHKPPNTFTCIWLQFKFQMKYMIDDELLELCAHLRNEIKGLHIFLVTRNTNNNYYYDPNKKYSEPKSKIEINYILHQLELNNSTVLLIPCEILGMVFYNWFFDAHVLSFVSDVLYLSKDFRRIPFGLYSNYQLKYYVPEFSKHTVYHVDDPKFSTTRTVCPEFDETPNDTQETKTIE